MTTHPTSFEKMMAVCNTTDEAKKRALTEAPLELNFHLALPHHQWARGLLR
ncbi:MAG: hypothetical protein AAFR36_32240 [Bacteroidota bacterium]